MPRQPRRIQLEAMPTAEGMAAEMEALHAVVKAELGEDGLPTGGGAEMARTASLVILRRSRPRSPLRL